MKKLSTFLSVDNVENYLSKKLVFPRFVRILNAKPTCYQHL